MSDIDFDELDRAVNGALNDNAPASHSSEPAPEPTLDIPTPAETPTIDHVERTVMNPTTPEKPAPTPSAPATRRTAGRFMDVVHPSSDMRPGSGKLVSETKPTSTPSIQPAPQPTAASDNKSWSEPLESPFLPDAKVEKRPLGGGESVSEAKPFDFQGLLDEPQEELIEAPESQERIEATSMPDPIDFAAASAIPPEIEEKTLEPEEPVTPEEAPAVETPVPAEAPTPVEAQPEVTPEEPQPVIEEPVGPTSITPQYKEQPSSNQESGAIYDTQSYHQPVSQPSKKKSSWFTIMWIVILVALGAAAGWAVYMYVLPTL